MIIFILFYLVARVRFSSATYSGVEGTQLNLIVEGDGQNQEPVLVEYSVLRTGTAGSMCLVVYCSPHMGESAVQA